MDYAILLSVLNLILVARLRLIKRDGSLSRKDLLIIGGIPLLVLPFLQVSLGWFLLLIVLVGAPFLLKAINGRGNHHNRNRGLLLALQILILAFICSPLINLSTNSLSQELLKFIDYLFFPNSAIDAAIVLDIQVFIFGLLLVLNEMNIVLRYFLRLMDLKSLSDEDKNAEGKVNDQEYNTGRYIGLLERIFVYVFVLMGQYTAIGFILAAKGVARFQDFKNRTFAEYVLIGTLLSTLLAMAVGYAVKLMIY